MARTTFDGPVRSLNGFLGTGPNMAQSIAGTVDGGTDVAGIDLYQGKCMQVLNTATTFNLPSIVDTANSAVAGPGTDPNSTNRVGMVYEFIVTENISGTSFILNAGTAAGRSTADVFKGCALYNNTATDPGVVTAWNAGGADTLTLNGTTQGGLEGSFIRCRAVDGLIWQIETVLVGNGTFSNPWS